MLFDFRDASWDFVFIFPLFFILMICWKHYVFHFIPRNFSLYSPHSHSCFLPYYDTILFLRHQCFPCSKLSPVRYVCTYTNPIQTNNVPQYRGPHGHIITQLLILRRVIYNLVNLGLLSLPGYMHNFRLFNILSVFIALFNTLFFFVYK